MFSRFLSENFISLHFAVAICACSFGLFGCGPRDSETPNSGLITATAETSKPEPSPSATELHVTPLATFSEAFQLTPDGGVWIDPPFYSSVHLIDTKFLYKMHYDPAIWVLVEGDSIKESPYRLVLKADKDCNITSTFPWEYGPGMEIEKEQITISGIHFSRSGIVVDGIPFFAHYCSDIRTPNANTCYALRGIVDSEMCNLESQNVLQTIQMIPNPFYEGGK